MEKTPKASSSSCWPDCAAQFRSSAFHFGLFSSIDASPVKKGVGEELARLCYRLLFHVSILKRPLLLIGMGSCRLSALGASG